MQQLAETRAPNDSSSSQAGEVASSPTFAGLLAALAAPAQTLGIPGDGSLPQGRRTAPAWSDDGLEDDIATLSYERALKAHARYRPTDQSLTQAVDPEPVRPEEPYAANAAATEPLPSPSAINSNLIANLESFATPEPNRLRVAPFERNLKDASITIRLSKTECAQLHRRAAEAGLTVSAYLRSCTFEAESLRAMVKDTLAQLRSATSQENSAPTRRSWFRGLTHWLAHLLTPWQSSRRVARA